MNWLDWSIGILILVVLGAVEGRAASLRIQVRRLERKLDLVLRAMNITPDACDELSEAVKEIARDPNRKIEAIKAYREETGASLMEAKQAVENYQASL